MIFLLLYSFLLPLPSISLSLSLCIHFSNAPILRFHLNPSHPFPRMFHQNVQLEETLTKTKGMKKTKQNKPESKSGRHHHLVFLVFLYIYFAGVTILVSQTVLSLLIRRVITKTSEAIPLLGSKLNSKKEQKKTKTIPKNNIQIKSNQN